MKINLIELYNIGSYEGKNCFDIQNQNDTGKIVLIGGKNGAGKTTLFTAIKLCLYGYKEAGYQSINAYYKKKIKKLINDRAKIEGHEQAYISLDIGIHNGHDWDNYYLRRFWSLKDDTFEHFSVWKNNNELSMEEISDFENYLMNLIPPELFDLYFFDGEQIADFFLESAGNERIKNAFLTLCGYDTFEILYKNFKRVNKSMESKDDVLEEYLKAEDDLYLIEKETKRCQKDIEDILNDIELKVSELKTLESQYTISGGVTVSEWNEKFLELKNEERFREEKNAWLKMAANDVIPYIIVQKELKKLLEIMNEEQEREQLRNAKTVLKSMLPEILEELDQDIDLSKKICDLMDLKLGQGIHEDAILKLSKEEYSKLSLTVNSLLNYKKEDVINARKEIKKSLNRSKKIRSIIENSSVDGVDTFLKEKDALILERENLIEKRELLNAEFAALQNKKKECEQEYKKISKELDKQLKSQSVNNLATKTILFLEELQKRLFVSEIEKVKKLFMFKIRQLMRKKQFIDGIEIDENFNIKVYKKIYLECKSVCKKIKKLTFEGYESEYGKLHCQNLLNIAGCNSLEEFSKIYAHSSEKLEVLLEFDKSTMSNGEKQVFIMSLYWAMMKLCSKKIPFIIDTPFARIDTEHRSHITEFFFKELSGQVFIFSTNEEITPEHVSVIGADLQAKFLIENIDNKKTTIESNKYFGE